MRTITAKLGNMRKAKEWVVYPRTAGAPGDTILIQSDARICRFDPVSGVGTLSANKSSGAYGIDLMKIRGATDVVVPASVIADALSAQPKSGDLIGPGVYVA